MLRDGMGTEYIEFSDAPPTQLVRIVKDRQLVYFEPEKMNPYHALLITGVGIGYDDMTRKEINCANVALMIANKQYGPWPVLQPMPGQDRTPWRTWPLSIPLCVPKGAVYCAVLNNFPENKLITVTLMGKRARPIQ